MADVKIPLCTSCGSKLQRATGSCRTCNPAAATQRRMIDLAKLLAPVWALLGIYRRTTVLAAATLVVASFALATTQTDTPTVGVSADAPARSLTAVGDAIQHPGVTLVEVASDAPPLPVTAQTAEASGTVAETNATVAAAPDTADTAPVVTAAATTVIAPAGSPTPSSAGGRTTVTTVARSTPGTTQPSATPPATGNTATGNTSDATPEVASAPPVPTTATTATTATTTAATPPATPPATPSATTTTAPARGDDDTTTTAPRTTTTPTEAPTTTDVATTTDAPSTTAPATTAPTPATTDAPATTAPPVPPTTEAAPADPGA